MQNRYSRFLIVFFGVLVVLATNLWAVAHWLSPPPYCVFHTHHGLYRLSPDEKKILLFTIENDPSTIAFRVLDVESRGEVWSQSFDSWQFGNSIPTVFFSPDSRKVGIFSSICQVVLIYDLDKKSLVKEHRPEMNALDDAFFDESGRLITRSHETLWDVEGNLSLGKIDRPFDDEVETYEPHGRVILLGFSNGVTKVVDARRKITTIGKLPVPRDLSSPFSITAAGNYMGYVEKNGEFVLMDNSTATTKRVVLPVATHFLDISSDGRMIACAAPKPDRGIFVNRVLEFLGRDITEETSLIEVESGGVVARLPGQMARDGPIFSEQGSFLLTYNIDSEQVMIWRWPIEQNWIPLVLANSALLSLVGLYFGRKFKAKKNGVEPT